MRKKKIPYTIIRLHKGKYSSSLTHQIIGILNTKKTNSQAVRKRFGYIQSNYKTLWSINFQTLGSCLNKGYKLNSTIKKLLFFYGNSYLNLKKKKSNVSSK